MEEEMSFRPIEESRYDEWDNFVDKAGGTIFHKAWWYRAWGADFSLYARSGDDGEIAAGIPVYISKLKRMPRVFGIKGLTKPPLTIVNGPLFLGAKKTSRCSIYSHAKREMLATIRSLPETGFYDFFLGRQQEDLMPFIWNGFDTQVYYTYVIPKEEAGSWREGISDAAKGNLRKARREAEARGCSIEADPPLEDVSPLIFESARRMGFAMKRLPRLLPGWWAAVRERGAGTIYALRDGAGKLLCVDFVVRDNHASYDLLGGMDEDVRRGPLNMLLYERAIADSLAMGLDFDFEGSIIRGVEDFFRRWGGELRPCYRVTKVPSILTYVGMQGYRYLKFHRKRDWAE